MKLKVPSLSPTLLPKQIDIFKPHLYRLYQIVDEKARTNGQTQRHSWALGENALPLHGAVDAKRPKVTNGCRLFHLPEPFL